MKKRKSAVRSEALVAQIYPLLQAGIDEGVATGLRKADKHADDPLTDSQRERVARHIEQAVSDALMDRFDIQDGRPSRLHEGS